MRVRGKFPPNARHMTFRCLHCGRKYRKTKSRRLVVEDFYFCSLGCDLRYFTKWIAEVKLLREEVRLLDEQAKGHDAGAEATLGEDSSRDEGVGPAGSNAITALL